MPACGFASCAPSCVWCQLSWPVSDNYFGRLAALFLPEPALDGVDGWRSPRQADRLTPWQRVTEAAEEVIAHGKSSPEAARELCDLMLFGRTDAEATRQVHRLLLDVGISAEFLSH
jgi:hypothetical protein